MGLWDDDDEELEVEESKENIYLADTEKGVELIAKLLSNEKYNKSTTIKMNSIKKLDYILEKKVLATSKINIDNEVKLYNRLIRLSDKLYENNKMKLLNNKTVIGIGGQFSAGKSKFINSIIKSDVLPEDQTPTTSIATYIVKGNSDEIRVYTYADNSIPIDMEAVKALTHAFYKKYNLGFSQFVNELVISNKEFQYENIAILDTPGYSKADYGVNESISDEKKAYNQLKNVDYLIWVVDIENGVIKNRDIEFIKSLEFDRKILIVFNKADKKTKSDIKNIIDESKEILSETNLNIYSVIAYSSFEEEEYFTNYLMQFMFEADRNARNSKTIYKEIEDILNEIKVNLNKKRSDLQNSRNIVGRAIFRSTDIMELESLARYYSDILTEISEIYKFEKQVFENEKEIKMLLRKIG